MKLPPLFQSKRYRFVIAMMGLAILLLLTFKVGEIVGERKASFSYRWAENYHRNFGGPRHGLWGRVADREYLNAHGVSGTVIRIEDATIVVNDQRNGERTILTTDATAIRKQGETIAMKDLRVGDHIVVIGEPDAQGNTVAKFIRVFSSSL